MKEAAGVCGGRGQAMELENSCRSRQEGTRRDVGYCRRRRQV